MPVVQIRAYSKTQKTVISSMNAMEDNIKLGRAEKSVVGTQAFAALLVCALLPLAGCYNGEALIAKAKAEASNALTEEVDLGRLVLTLPRHADRTTTVTLKLELFASISQRDLEAFETLLGKKKTAFQYALLMTLRQATEKELAEPSLASVRARIFKVGKEAFAELPPSFIGIKKLSILEQ